MGMQNSDALVAGFMVIHSNQMEQLRDLLVQWTQSYPLHPLENEVILVQSNGIAQWLKYALASNEGLGIAASVQVSLPARFLWQSYRAVLGTEQIASSSPLDKNQLLWRLMRLLPSLLEDERFKPLKQFLAKDDDLRKLYQLCERIADIFDQYQVYRADWLEQWAAGRDQIDQRGQPYGLVVGVEVDCTDLPMQTLAWQAQLWRVLLEDIGQDSLDSSRASVHPRFVKALQEAQQRPQGLPRRVIVLGISSLPAQTVEALSAMARFSQVILCVHNPCQFYWGDIVADKDLLRRTLFRHQRKQGMPSDLDNEQLHQFAHPLLATWGKQGRDYIALLEEFDNPESYRDLFQREQQRIDLFVDDEPETVLSQLQNDILHLRPLQESQPLWPAVDCAQDESIRFHIAHSPQREVEILHDQLLDRFARYPHLQPRDVIVMVPDIDLYTPFIEAVFAQFNPGDARYIPYTLSDQGGRGREPILIALEQLLNVSQARISLTEVLALLDVPAIRQRFGVVETDLPILQRWLIGAGARWGLNAEQRVRLGLPEAMEQNTWRFALRRMLLGYAMGQGTDFAGIEPYTEVAGLEAALLGPLVLLLDELDVFAERLSHSYSPADWTQLLVQLLERFFTGETEQELLLLQRLQQSVHDWADACAQAELGRELPLTVVREAWLTAVDAERSSQRFLAGSVNFCTLMPMRTIPFQMVCLLGMNDGDYPRSVPPVDFDLMANNYRPGDRSRREDDRYLLLEALLAARQMLYISWVGRDERDNTTKPPSVLVGQLRDHLQQGWQLEDEGDLLAALTQEHPLQPFSRAYFSATNANLFTYAQEWAQLHQSAQGAVNAVEPIEPPLPALQLADPLSIRMLHGFLRNPVAQFFAQRFKAYISAIELEQLDDEPFSLGFLGQYGLKQQLLNEGLQALEQGADVNAAMLQQSQKLLRSGELPMYGFGEQLAQNLLEPVQQQFAHYSRLCEQYPLSETAAQRVSYSHAGIQLEDWLAPVRSGADKNLHIELFNGPLLSKKKLRWHRLLAVWLQHVLHSLTQENLTSIVVAEDIELQILPLSHEQAAQILNTWLEAWQQGMCRPLPVAVRTAFAWLTVEHDKKLSKEEDASLRQEKALASAAECYEGTMNTSGEAQQSPILARHYADFTALNASQEFTYWAQQLYQPLFVRTLEQQPVSENEHE